MCGSFLPSSFAQTITGSIEAIEHPSYAGIASNFRISNARVDGETIYDGEILIFCADLDAISLDEDLSSYPHELSSTNSPLVLGAIENFDIWDRYSKTQDEAYAMAMLHWFVDHHYESAFLNGDETSQYAFQNVVWEIFGDGGTANGLNFNTGNIDRSKFSPYGRKEAPELWAAMNAMLDTIENSGVDASYSPKYQLLGIEDVRPDHQDYLALAATLDPMAIPEPGVPSLLGVAGLFLACRRSRSGRG
ncbi:hypothetical protein [Haloferula sp. A504]|uniref:hypothetical protein n=1 Tax=Haloferula sp. A504 TaxID=3373601 RepID=UPI0031C6A43D|nr:hypothetical protein [Verrucomicrobiaceae bacterium E54]